ncbi:MAG: VCBS repeat-containing protein, partial [Planctomycetota bacterium]
QRHPDYLPAAGFSAVLMAHDQDYLSLLDLLSRYESTPSTNPQLWYARGRLHQHLGHHSQALACYARSMRHGCVLRSVPSRMVECLEVISADGDVSQNIDMRVSKGDVALATRHATDVLQLRGLCRRVNANGTVSQTVCFSLAQTLMRLGREDQARHWAAIGFRSAQFQVENPALTYKRILSSQDRSSSIPRSTLNRWAGLDHSAEPEDATNDERIDGATLCRLRQYRAEVQRLADRELSASNPDEQIAASTEFEMVDEAIQRGIDFQFDHGHIHFDPGQWLHHSLGGGVAVLDFDQNGWDDLFLVQAGGWPSEVVPQPEDVKTRTQTDRSDRLYSNHRGNFTGVQFDIDDNYGCGVAAGDVNEDGFPDLLVCNIGQNRIWINNGDGTFSPSALWRDPHEKHWSTSAAIADFNVNIAEMISI